MGAAISKSVSNDAGEKLPDEDLIDWTSEPNIVNGDTPVEPASFEKRDPDDKIDKIMSMYKTMTETEPRAISAGGSSVDFFAQYGL